MCGVVGHLGFMMQYLKLGFLIETVIKYTIQSGFRRPPWWFGVCIANLVFLNSVWICVHCSGHHAWKGFKCKAETINESVAVDNEIKSQLLWWLINYLSCLSRIISTSLLASVLWSLDFLLIFYCKWNVFGFWTIGQKKTLLQKCLNNK